MHFRIVLLAVLSITTSNLLHAQGSYTSCTNKYFESGGISTSECYDSQHRFGKALAYNRHGKTIYEQSLRKVGGHSYVVFSYYNDGSVSRAEWHDAPDGGIQWYSSVTTFNRDGSIHDVSDQSYDDTRQITVPKRKKEF